MGWDNELEKLNPTGKGSRGGAISFLLLLSTHCVSGTVLITGDIAMIKVDKILILGELTF